MTTVFTRQIASAKRLLDKYGQFVTWQQNRAVAGAVGWLASANTAPINNRVKIAFLPNSRVGFETMLAAAIGQEIKTGSVIGYMAQVTFVPTIDDVVLRPGFGASFVLGSGEALRPAKIDELNVDGTPILYTITFAK